MSVYRALSSSTADELFYSKGFQKFLEDTTNNHLRRYKKGKVKIHVLCENEQVTASTNGKETRINANFYMIKKLRGNLQKFMFIRGFNGHELGHLLFDDFDILQKIQAQWRCGNMYPLSEKKELLSKKQKNSYEEITGILSKKNNASSLLLRLYLHLDNILSDSFVNEQIIKQVSTYKEDLRFVLNNMKMELEGYSETKKVKSDTEKILLYLHYYSVYQKTFMEDDEMIKQIIRLHPLLEMIKVELNAVNRTCLYQVIFCEIWDYLKECFSEVSNDNSQKGDSETEDESPDEGNESDMSDGFGKAGSGSKTGEDQAEAKAPSLDELDSLLDELESMATIRPQTTMGGSYSVNESELVLPELPDAIDESEIQSFLEKDDVPETGATNSERIYKRILDMFEKECECKKNEEQKEAELQEFKKEVDDTNHKNVTALVCSPKIQDDAIDEYNNVYKTEAEKVAKKIAMDIKRKLSKKTANTMSGFYSGKRINYPAVIRNEAKVFERNKFKSNELSATFMLLCDESGSTAGRRNYYIKLASLVFLSLAKELKLPVGVIGHKAETTCEKDNRMEYADVILNVYSDFEFDDKSKYKIVSEMSPSGCNRDGYALSYACERLLRRNEKQKFFIMLTDGKPNAKGYKGEKAKKDCAFLCEKYKKKGIILIIAAIGDDKTAIKSIYGDSFLDIKNPKEIPNLFAQLLKKLYGI